MKLASLNADLKSKEKENKMSKLKIKEMRRMLKHNQLKPLNVASGANPTVEDSNSNSHATGSQVKLAPLNKDNLQQLQKQQKDDGEPVEDGGAEVVEEKQEENGEEKGGDETFLTNQ